MSDSPPKVDTKADNSQSEYGSVEPPKADSIGEECGSEKKPTDSKTDKEKADKENADEGNSEADNPNYSYDSEGVLVYTDPTSKQEYILNADKSDWIPKPAKADNNYDFDGTTYSYTDKTSGDFFKWDLEAKEWVKADKKGEKKADGDKSESDEESEMSSEDENMTEEEKAQRRYRKRKAQPGWGKAVSFSEDSQY